MKWLFQIRTNELTTRRHQPLPDQGLLCHQGMQTKGIRWHRTQQPADGWRSQRLRPLHFICSWIFHFEPIAIFLLKELLLLALSIRGWCKRQQPVDGWRCQRLRPLHLDFSASAHHMYLDFSLWTFAHPNIFTVGSFYKIAAPCNGLKVLTSPAIVFTDTRKRPNYVTLWEGRLDVWPSVLLQGGGARQVVWSQPGQSYCLPASDQVTQTGPGRFYLAQPTSIFQSFNRDQLIIDWMAIYIEKLWLIDFLCSFLFWLPDQLEIKMTLWRKIFFSCSFAVGGRWRACVLEKYILRNTFWEIYFEKYILRNTFWEIDFEWNTQ